MQFKDIVGQKDTKHDLIQSFKSDKISHAQLFLGKPAGDIYIDDKGQGDTFFFQNYLGGDV